MDREIKFRAKMVDSDDWMYGYLREVWGENQRNFVIAPAKKFKYDGYTDMEEDYVQPETIGEFTGLVDKNGVDIYEGDIITYSKEIINGVIFPEKGFVKYRTDHAMFVLQTDTGDELLSYCRRHIEVIGNVFDNPELLEEE